MVSFRTLVSTSLLVWSGLICGMTSAQEQSLEQKSAFSDTWPRIFTFRGENSKTANASYEAWEAAQDGTSGFIKKFIPEEVPIAAATPGFANRYAESHPDKLALLHLNGEARQVCDFPDVRDRYFPGHWVYLPGSVLTADCSATENVVKVKNAKPLNQKGYIVRKGEKSGYLPQMVILVRLDEEGNRLWYESEFAEISQVDLEAGCLTLRRGVYGTEPLAYKAGETYIAPIAGGLWGKEVMFYYNLSSTCPRDKNGKQALDVYSDEIAAWLQPKGVLRQFDGICFDVNYSDVSRRGAKWDVDNDGKADGGWIAGRNVWKEGDLTFFAKLREKIGDRYLITADGQHWDNQQFPGLLNGIESEGLVQHNDMWRGFSRTMNTHTYWMNHLGDKQQLRYVVMKLMGQDVSKAFTSRRFGAACASCLGAAVTVPVGEDKNKCQGFEFIPSPYDQEGRLGHPKGELIRCFRSAAASDLLNGQTLHLDHSCCRQYKDGEVAELEYTLENVKLPAGDVVISVKAELLEHDSDLSEEYDVPALLWLEPENLPKYNASKLYDSYFKELYGLFGKGEGDEMTFYYRNMEAGLRDLKFRVRGANAALIKEVRIYNAPDVILRQFEHAVVVANPSLQPVSINLSEYLQVKGLKTVTVPPVDAVYVEM